MGEDNFTKLLKAVPEHYAWKSISTDDFHKLAEDIHGSSLNYFFQQWIESSGAPEMTLAKFTVLRVQQARRGSGGCAAGLPELWAPSRRIWNCSGCR